MLQDLFFSTSLFFMIFEVRNHKQTQVTILSIFIVNTASIVLEFQTSFGQTLCTKRVTQFGIWIYLGIINQAWLTQKLLTWHNVCLLLCTSKLVLHHKCLCSIIVYSYFYGFIILSTAFVFKLTACEGMHWADFWKVSSLCMLPQRSLWAIAQSRKTN